MKSRGILFPLVDKTPLRRHWSGLITAASLLLAGTSALRAQNTLSPLTVPTIADLRAMNASTFTNGTSAFVIDYYAASASAGATGYLQGEGGGHFRWWTNAHTVPSLISGVAIVDDGGRFIACNSYTNGIWERVLNGAVPNVKMWGAYGNGVANDWVACQNALTACGGWSSELCFPLGSYLMTNTLVCGTTVYVHGQQNVFCEILMATNYFYDIYRTQNAQNAIIANNGSFSDDHGLHISDLFFKFLGSNSWNSCVVVCAPGEANSIQRIHTENGAIGVRSLGSGTPGLWLRDCCVSGVAVAGVSIEAVPGGAYDNTGIGPVMLSGVSGDCHDAVYGPTATLIRITNSATSVMIEGVKGEGDYGGGLIQWSYPAGNGGSGYGADWVYGNLTIHGVTYNSGTIPESQTNGPPILRLQGIGTNSTRTPSVLMDDIRFIPSLTSILIDDQVYGRQVEANTTGPQQTDGRLPIGYESEIFTAPTTNMVGILHGVGSFSRYVVGQNAYSSFYAKSNGWYRVMQPMPLGIASRMAGRLTVSSPEYGESTELQVEVSPFATVPANAILLNVTRCPAAATTVLPVITQARATYYTDTGGGQWAFLDLYVGNVPNPTFHDQLVVVALDLAGYENRYTGCMQLVAPIQMLPGTYTPPTGAVSATVSTTR